MHSVQCWSPGSPAKSYGRILWATPTSPTATTRATAATPPSPRNVEVRAPGGGHRRWLLPVVLADSGAPPSPSPVVLSSPPSPYGGCGSVSVQRDRGHDGAAAPAAPSSGGRRTAAHHDGAVPAPVLDGQPEPDTPAPARAVVRSRSPSTTTVAHQQQ